ncbi:ABC transporter ATP-binding protein [Capnocytophaga cynodegmi]|uniref:Bacitracin transport ATP-binding protein BcrA n=1 Tax=Capnocytophaga cynodegmi TaxID=28189 RepID=A0A0B7HR40_9FLAO|nr:ABC transporter ATP-binding protein [Capnocytophaga cynodegmi]CEN40367.1 Bacitracin transport ATP-binding protein BcrA [Capnocytophaga cynodegmi]
MEVIQTNSLSKRFGATLAVNNISVHVKQGEIYGFLGLNGAGKTTLIRMLLGMIKPDNGTISLFGKPITSKSQNWNDIGYLVETPYSYPNLSVYENLKVIGKLRHLTDKNAIENIIEKLKLTKYKNTPAQTLSLGNQQRLGLAKALIHEPKLLILDEPINGLDPEGIVQVRNLLIELAQKGSTIFLSSHILGEISKLAHRIGIIHEGKLIKELTTDELSNQIIKKILVQTTDNQKALHYLQNSNYSAVQTNTDEIEISSPQAVAHPEHISKLLTECGLPPKQIFLFTEDLEMFFLRTINNHK